MEVFPRKPGVGDPTIEELTRTIQDRFVGKISQVPPAYSAIKEGGERAYRKMRQGRGVDLPAREVEIAKCDVVAYDYPVATLRVSCGSGTYIRSLAHDLGAELRVGGHLSALRRVSAGMPARTTDGSSITWNVQDAVQIEDVKWADVIPLKEILAGFPRIDLSDSDASNVRHGRDIDGDVEQNTIGWHEELPIAILEPVTGGVHARKVL
jgi:tRNA pseudouridine55 synthase